MSGSNSGRTKHVFRDDRDADGTVYRAVALTEDGGLAITGQDLGAGVERAFGYYEYEFERRLSGQEAATLRRLLDVPVDADLLAAITDHFASTTELEAFLQQHELLGQFWSRIGD